MILESSSNWGSKLYSAWDQFDLTGYRYMGQYKYWDLLEKYYFISLVYNILLYSHLIGLYL